MLKKVIVPIIVLIVAGLATVMMVRARPTVEKVPQEVPAPPVRVMAVQPSDLVLSVRSQGTVEPETEAELVAEVAGSINWVAPTFEEGGFFERGQKLLELDRRDYQLQVASARAQVAQARVALVRERAEADVALEEWQELGEGEANPLVLRQPQLEEARARLDAAEATLAKAELDLERTAIRAPFVGRLRAKRVDLGEFVGRGTPLATIYSVAAAEVRLLVPDAELAFLDLPLGSQLGTGGPPVTLEASFAGTLHRWQGRIVRTGGAIDPTSRMVPLIARVDAPYQRSGDRPPLSVGLFVKAQIEGRVATGVFELPRSALRGPTTLLVVDADERLHSRQVDVLRTTAESAIVRGGLEPGERVCLTQLDTFIEGMRVQPRLDEAGAEGPASADVP